MNHLVVCLPPAAVFCELVAWKKTLPLFSVLVDLTQDSGFRQTARTLPKAVVQTTGEHTTKRTVKHTESSTQNCSRPLFFTTGYNEKNNIIQHFKNVLQSCAATLQCCSLTVSLGSSIRAGIWPQKQGPYSARSTSQGADLLRDASWHLEVGDPHSLETLIQTWHIRTILQFHKAEMSHPRSAPKTI